jgi:peptidyl-prolyl cis-trans isomerase B (cyclophilin B)
MKNFVMIINIFFMAFAISFCSIYESNNMKDVNGDEGANEKKNERNPHYVIKVTQKGELLGEIVVETFPEVAPKMCAHFDSLVSTGFYNGLAFHRVIPRFMIQGGDPNSRNKPKDTWGIGDPSQKTVPAEFSDISHKRGILSTARKGNDINSATSQFFIMVANAPHLDGQYTVFGRVLEGMDVADKIVSTATEGPNRPIDKIEMEIKKK